MKITKKLMTGLLALLMVLSPLAMVVPAQAATVTAEPTVYDIYDLTGKTENTINGTGKDNWSATVFGHVDAADKENFSIKAKVKIIDGNEHRLSLGALDSKDCVDITGYGLVIHAEMGKVIFARDGSWIASWDFNIADLSGDDVEMEFGYRDILSDGQRIGKHIFLKINGVVLHTHDDTNGYLTGDALGTKVALFHYGTVVQMDTTYTTSYGTANVYNIYDLTGSSEFNVAPWASTKIGSIAAAHKEQAAIKINMNITDARHRYRFSVGAAEGVDCTDPQGYGVEIAVQFDGYNFVKFTRGNGSQIKVFGDVSPLIGEHDIEFGYRNILLGSNIIGKQVYLSVDGVDVYTYDDTNGYLTGDALGTMVALHHIDDAAVQLKATTYYGEAKVYDLYDLSDAVVMYRPSWELNNLDLHKIGSISAEDKEQAAFKFKLNLTDEAQRYRFSLGAPEDANCIDPKGYGLEIGVRFDNNRAYQKSYITFIRNGSWLKNSWSQDDIDFYELIGEHDFEFGYRNIMSGNQIIGKRIYLKMDGAEVYTYDDMEGFLTGDALGTKVALFYNNDTSGSDAKLESTYDFKCYDISELTGNDSNTYSGAGNGNWNPSELEPIAEADKENVSIKANVSITEDIRALRFSLGALDTDDLHNSCGYGFNLQFDTTLFENDPTRRLAFTYGSGARWWASMSDPPYAMSDFAGEYELEFGYRTVVLADNTRGKEVFLKKNGNDMFRGVHTNGYLTGDALGTKVALFHYGTTLQMNATTQTACTHDYKAQTIAPDCLNDGKVRYTCTICGAAYNEDGDTALGHNYVATVTPPTCTAQGYTTHVCSGCGDTYVDSYVDATDHKWDEGKITTAPGCESAGVKTYTCTSCGTTKTESVAATGHSYVATVTAPTCTEKGYTTHKCSVCGDSYVDSYVDAKGHSWNAGEITTAPGCESAGVKTYTCTSCGTTKTESVDATGHNYVATVTAPTCTEKGYTTHKCSVCGNSYVDTYVDAKGHTAVTDAAVAPTCTATGLTEGSHCGVCDAVLVKQEVVAATGHNLTTEAKQDGATAYLLRTCQNKCGYSEQVNLAFSGASLTLENTLIINYAVKASVFAEGNFEEPYVEFSYGNRVNDLRIVVDKYTVGKNASGEDVYIFSCYGITPSQIGDTVTAVLHAKYADTDYTHTNNTYSVSQYCYNMLRKENNTNANLKTLLVDLLYYCDAARAYTTYKVEEAKVTANLTEAEKACATTSTPELTSILNTKHKTVEDPKVTWKGASVVLYHSVAMRFRFAVENIESADDLSVKVTMGGEEWVIANDPNEEYKPIKEDTQNPGQYYVIFDEMKARDMRTAVYITVYEGENAISNTVCYSVESYACAKQNDANVSLADLVKALMRYGDSAVEYFASK